MSNERYLEVLYTEPPYDVVIHNYTILKDNAESYHILVGSLEFKAPKIKCEIYENGIIISSDIEHVAQAKLIDNCIKKYKDIIGKAKELQIPVDTLLKIMKDQN